MVGVAPALPNVGAVKPNAKEVDDDEPPANDWPKVGVAAVLPAVGDWNANPKEVDDDELETKLVDTN